MYGLGKRAYIHTSMHIYTRAWAHTQDERTMHTHKAHRQGAHTRQTDKTDRQLVLGQTASAYRQTALGQETPRET